MKTNISSVEGNKAGHLAGTAVSRTAMGAAALGTVFTLPVAVDAAVVYSGVQNINVTLPVSQRDASNQNSDSHVATAPLNLDGNAVNDFRLHIRQSHSDFDGTHEGTARLQGLGNNLVLASGFEGNIARNLSASNMVSLGQSQTAGQNALLRRVSSWSDGSSVTGNFSPSQTGIAGVAFDIDGDTHFGWIRLHVGDGDLGYPVSITAIDWAYEGLKNTPIHVPDTFTVDVPEANPGLVLLAAGGTGLVAWRLRRRKEANEAAKV